MNDDKKVAVSPSRPLICSADGVSENAERKPPNLRTVQCCYLCQHEEGFDDLFYCAKHKQVTLAHHLCDDYK